MLACDRSSGAASAKVTHTRSEVFSAKEWGNLWNVGAKCNIINLRTVIAAGDVIFEYDYNKYACPLNPGVGPALGVVKDPECGGDNVEIDWADGDCEVIRRKYVRLGPRIGDTFVREGVTYSCKELLDRGVRASVTKEKQTAHETRPQMESKFARITMN